jgi:hypothetical protein
MGKTFRRKQIVIPENYWEFSHEVKWIYKEIDAKAAKRD